MKNSKLKGNLILMLTAVTWGTGFIAQKIGLDTLPPLAFNGLRYLLAMVVLVPLLAFNIKKTGYFDKASNSISQLAYKKKNAALGGILSGLFMAISVNLQQLGMVTLSASKSGFETALYIVFVPLLGIFIGRKPERKVYLCCIIAISGFLLLSGQDGLGQIGIGDILTLLSAMFFAIQIWVVSGFVNKDNDIILSVLTLGIAGVLTMIVSIIFEQPTWAEIMNTMPAIVFAALVPTSIGYTCQIVGQNYTDSTSAAFIMSLESVFAVIFGAIFLGERLTPLEMIGCAMIFGANAILQLRPSKDSMR